MKRLLPLILLLLLLLLNACVSSARASTDMWVVFDQTLTATMWTPTLSPTPNISIPTMIGWLNFDFSSTADPLEQTLDAKYVVTDLSYPKLQDGAITVLRVDVKCICPTNAACCTPERTFVVIMGAMKRNSNTVMVQVPAAVSELIVVCYERDNLVGAMSAKWPDVKDYLLGQLSGYQLGVRVVRTVVP